MEITGIGPKNMVFFEPILFSEHTRRPDRLMMGVIQQGYPIAAGVMDSFEDAGQIKSLFTLPEFRKKGAAGMVLDAFSRVAKHAGLNRIEVDYTSSCKGISELLSRKGYMILPGEKLFKANCKKIIMSPKSEILFKRTKISKSFCLEDIGKQQLWAVNKYLELKGMLEFAAKSDKKLSFVSFNAEKNIDGVMYCALYDKEVRIELMVTEGNSAMLPIKFVQMLIYKMQELGIVDNDISFVAINPRITELFTSVFDEEGFFDQDEQGMFAFKNI